jgi:hypothetical protein
LENGYEIFLKTITIMKKVLITALFAIGLFSVNAQSVDFGLKAGVNFSTLRGENLSVESRTGFHVGAVAEFGLGDKFSLQPELLYTQLGTKGETGGDFKSEYISLPVMAKYYVFQGLSLEVGPQASLLIGDEFKLADGSIADVEIEDFDLGLNFGLGYNFDNGLFVQSRYTLGITEVQENPDVKNGAFQFSLGYLF